MLFADDRPAVGDSPRLRLVQHKGRRHAISVEPSFWAALGDAASELGVRLNRLVGELAAAPDGPPNLAARLRLFCLRRARRQLAEARASAGRTNVALVVAACPAPCLIISPARTIVTANRALEAFFQASPGQMNGRPLAEFFRLNLGRSLAEAAEAMDPERPTPIAGHLTYMMPGRVVGARVTLCPVARTEDGGQHFLLFVERQGERGAG
ncbi:ribbon-helix-helix domain-containing protein [Inquilinus sp. CAU 1745]|uniref:ribbon-helix-helix domain-containing protein n=1 Tax=Inquilinus sp. CAU 1745 TaxID=3140369 RepID=UPI00325B7849